MWLSFYSFVYDPSFSSDNVGGDKSSEMVDCFNPMLRRKIWARPRELIWVPVALRIALPRKGSLSVAYVHALPRAGQIL